MIDRGVVDGPLAILIGLIANYIESPWIRTREGHNGCIRIPRPLPLLSSVERERLSLDRTGAVALRPGYEELVERDVNVPRDPQKLRPNGLLIGAGRRNHAEERC